MADIPRDPRQLARDILSGKIKLEDLQRERQRQGGMAPGRPAPPPPQPPPTARNQPVRQVPIGPGSAGTAQQQRPPMQTRPPQRPVPPTVRGPQFPTRGRSIPTPTPTPPPKHESLAPVQKEYEQPQDVAPKATKPPRKAVMVRELAKNKQTLRQGILLAEVLGKPVGLREGW